MTVQQATPPWVETFNAWVWRPQSFSWRIRGISTARLDIYPGGFTVRAVGLERRLFGWDEVEYTWAAVVLETHIPTWDPGLLFEFRSELARCGLKPWDRRSVVAALERAGLAIIEVRHLGWEAPHRAGRGSRPARERCTQGRGRVISVAVKVQTRCEHAPPDLRPLRSASPSRIWRSRAKVSTPRHSTTRPRPVVVQAFVGSRPKCLPLK